MLNRSFFVSLFRILVLVLVQVFIFNNISFQNYALPFVYVLFLILQPVNQNKYLFLFFSFILGASIDFFDNTPGIHSFSLVFVAYLRFFVFKIFKKQYLNDDQDLDIRDLNWFSLFLFSLILIVIHHSLVFFFYDMQIQFPEQLGLKIAYSSILSMVFVVLYLMLFKRRKSE